MQNLFVLQATSSEITLMNDCDPSEEIKVSKDVINEINIIKEENESLDEFLIKELNIVPELERTIGHLDPKLKSIVREFVKEVHKDRYYSISTSYEEGKGNIIFESPNSGSKLLEIRAEEQEVVVLSRNMRNEWGESGRLRVEGDEIISELNYMRNRMTVNSYREIVQKCLADIRSPMGG